MKLWPTILLLFIKPSSLSSMNGQPKCGLAFTHDEVLLFGKLVVVDRKVVLKSIINSWSSSQNEPQLPAQLALIKIGHCCDQNGA